MFYKFFDKKAGPAVSLNEHLAEKSHKPVIKKFKKRKTYADWNTIFGQQI